MKNHNTILIIIIIIVSFLYLIQKPRQKNLLFFPFSNTIHDKSELHWIHYQLIFLVYFNSSYNILIWMLPFSLIVCNFLIIDVHPRSYLFKCNILLDGFWSLEFISFSHCVYTICVCVFFFVVLIFTFIHSKGLCFHIVMLFFFLYHHFFVLRFRFYICVNITCVWIESVDVV